MRILFIHNKYQQYGGEDRAVELAVELFTSRGHEVRVLFFDNREIAGSWIGKITSFRNAISNPSSSARLQKIVHEFRPDIIHVFNLFYVASPSVLKEAHLLGIPIVYTLQNYRLVCAGALLLRDNKPCEICIRKKLPLAGIRYRCYKNSALASAMVTLSTGIPKLSGQWKSWVDKYIVQTEFAKEKLINSSLDVSPDQLVTIENFVPDLGLGASKREPYYLFVGRISPEKGVKSLVQAFQDMPEQTLLIAGDGPDKAALMSEYQSAHNIRFLGNCSKEEVIGLMKNCRALIFPSIWYEGQPYVMMEAFSTGTPILASNLGAMASMVKDGYNGLVFNPGNIKEIKSVISRFQANVTDMYRQARETYLNHFHPEIHYQSVMQIYDQSIRAKEEGSGK